MPIYWHDLSKFVNGLCDINYHFSIGCTAWSDYVLYIVRLINRSGHCVSRYWLCTESNQITSKTNIAFNLKADIVESLDTSD